MKPQLDSRIALSSASSQPRRTGVPWLREALTPATAGLLPVYRYPVYSVFGMIRSFGDKRTEALFRDEFVRDFQGFARIAKRKLEAVNAASRIEDLMVPPSNRLEKLKGDLRGFYSIRVNDQWRVILRWIEGEPHEVRVVDYH